MSELIKKHLDSLTELEKLILIRDSANTCIRNLKSKDKAVESEFNSGFNRTGIRGGKFTTLAANAMRWTDSYNKNVELLIDIFKEIKF